MTDTTTGIMKAIEWLRQKGRPILADKIKRELLYADSKGKNPTLTLNQDSGRCIERIQRIGTLD